MFDELCNDGCVASLSDLGCKKDVVAVMIGSRRLSCVRGVAIGAEYVFTEPACAACGVCVYRGEVRWVSCTAVVYYRIFAWRWPS